MEWFPCFYGCPHIGPSSQDCTQCEFDILDLSVRRLHAESPELERASPSTNEREEGFDNDALMAADWRQLGTALWYSLLPTDHPAAIPSAEERISRIQAEETTGQDAQVDLSSQDDGEHSDEDTEEGGAKLW